MKKTESLRSILLLFFILPVIILTNSCRGKVTPVNYAASSMDTSQQTRRIEWWHEAKFGMFIHWGPYSLLGGEWKGKRPEQGVVAEWIMNRLKIPVEEYRTIASTFNPTEFNPQDWVNLAKNTGMKYMIITAKHHDGFAMYDSEVSQYNIVDQTPFKRDVIRELSDACAEAGIRFGVYYSHREDWEHPYAYGNTWDFDSSQTDPDTMNHPDLFRKYLDEKSIPQLRELLTNYGPLSIIWFDRGMYTQEQGKEFADLVHSLQPNCLVNGRVGHYYKELLGDYQNLNDNGMPPGGIEEYWETPQTLNDTWGYCRYDNNWKQPREIIRRLVSIVSKGGNYLLNVGPTGEGIIPQPSVDILNAVGEWMKGNAESIYGTSASPFPYELPWGYCTVKGALLYLHIFDWPQHGYLELEGLNNQIHKAYMMTDKVKSLTVNRDSNDNHQIFLPETSTDNINSVVVLEISGEPDVDPLVIRQEGLDPVLLDYLTANTFGKAVKRFNRKGEQAERYHISKMQNPDDIIGWFVDFETTGLYNAYIKYSAISEWDNCAYILEVGNSKIKGTVRSSEGWYDYKTESAGQLRIEETGLTTIRLYPENSLDHYLMYFNSIVLVRIGDTVYDDDNTVSN